MNTVPKRPLRQIAVGDIHGCFDLLKMLIEKVIVFSPRTDQLIFMGDYIDRQKKNKEVVGYVYELKKQHPDEILLLKGNHEDMAHAALKGTGTSSDMAKVLWYLNGGTATVQSYGSFEAARKALIPFIESLELFYETDSHIFVHAGVPTGDIHTATKAELLWDRSLGYDGHKTLIVGHTPMPGITRIGNIICVDTGAFHTGILSGYDVFTGTTYDTRTT